MPIIPWTRLSHLTPAQLPNKAQRLHPLEKARALSLAGLALLLGACQNPCGPLQDEYEKALEQEKSLAGPSLLRRETPTHFGLAMKLSLLNQVLERTLTTDAGELFNTKDSFSVLGQTVGYETKGTLKQAKLLADPGCPNCVKVDGILSGTLTLTLPVVGKSTFPLEAPLKLVAPLTFAGTDTGGVIQLNLKQLSKVGKSEVKVPTATLPSPWNEVLSSPLGKAVLAQVGGSAGVVDLYTFDAPDLGLDGLKVAPSVLEVTAKENLLFVGLTSNLPGLDEKDGGIPPLRILGSSYNMAVSVHQRVLLPALQAALRSGEVPRAYNSKGDASPDGPYFLTLDGLEIQKGERARGGGHPFQLGFRLWHLPKDSPTCYWMKAEANGKLKVTGGKLKTVIEGAKITRSSLPEAVLSLTNWAGAKFLERSAQVIRTSFDPERIGMPGGELEVRELFMSVHEKSLNMAVKAEVKVNMPQAGQGASRTQPAKTTRPRKGRPDQE